MDRIPSVFIAHGTPMLALAEDRFTLSVQSFFKSLPKLDAIVVVSAQLSSGNAVEICASPAPEIAYDFTGFPNGLYDITYECPGSPQLAVRIASLLADSGFRTALNTQARMNYRTWIPLRVAVPEANIPVVHISMPVNEGPRMMLKLGKALSPLRGENVLLMGSGGAVYNQQRLKWHNKDGTGESWAQKFEEWVKAQLLTKNVEALVDFENSAPDVKLAHPTPEHFYPLLFSLGAAWQGDQAEPIYEGIQYSSVSMLSFALVDASKRSVQ